MRSHQKIVRDEGAARLARRLVERGHQLHPGTPQRWADRGSIPGEYWADFAAMGVATLEELAAGAAKRRAPEQSAEAA
jgi:hypothetical protein